MKAFTSAEEILKQRITQEIPEYSPASMSSVWRGLGPEETNRIWLDLWNTLHEYSL